MRFRRLQVARTTPSTSTHFTPSPHVVAAVHGASTALLDMRAERYYTLNVVGSRVWEMLGAGHSVDQIATSIADEFDAPLARIDSDVRALLGRLEDSSLILPTAEAAEP